jgi:hypothetical protein
MTQTKIVTVTIFVSQNEDRDGHDLRLEGEPFGGV